MERYSLLLEDEDRIERGQEKLRTSYQIKSFLKVLTKMYLML